LSLSWRPKPRLNSARSLSRFWQGQRPSRHHEWLSDNGSCYIAGDTGSFACDIGLERESRRSKVRGAKEWPKPSSVPSRATTCASVHVPTEKPSCESCFVDHPLQRGSPTQRVHRRSPKSPTVAGRSGDITPINLFSPPIGLRVLLVADAQKAPLVLVVCGDSRRRVQRAFGRPGATGLFHSG
jgi:hypothetical protein